MLLVAEKYATRIFTPSSVVGSETGASAVLDEVEEVIEVAGGSLSVFVVEVDGAETSDFSVLLPVVAEEVSEFSVLLTLSVDIVEEV